MLQPLCLEEHYLSALQLPLDSFASGGDEFYHWGVLLPELVLCLELREVVSYGENARL